MLKSVNPKIIKVYDIICKMPENNKIRIREHVITGAPDIIYYKGTVENFYNGKIISVHIAEKLSILQVDKIYCKHNKITIEVLSPKLSTSRI